jgi:hypothetical protein
VADSIVRHGRSLGSLSVFDTEREGDRASGEIAGVVEVAEDLSVKLPVFEVGEESATTRPKGKSQADEYTSKLQTHSNVAFGQAKEPFAQNATVRKQVRDLPVGEKAHFIDYFMDYSRI